MHLVGYTIGILLRLLVFECCPLISAFYYWKHSEQWGVVWLRIWGECKAPGEGENSQRPTRTALGNLMNITANAPYYSFFCVQNTTLLRYGNFNTTLAICQCRKEKEDFCHYENSTLNHIPWNNEGNVTEWHWFVMCKEMHKFINSQIAGAGRQATPN